MSNERILLVEDEEEVAGFIEATLCTLGYTTIPSADSGELALSRAIRFKPDLVLMDIGLKGAMDGIEAAKKIYSNLDVPVVFVTAMNNEGTFLRAKSAEPFGFVLKPVKSQELGNAIEIALYQHFCGRKRANTVAKEAEEKCRAIYQNAAAGIVSAAIQGKPLDASPYLLGILGCSSCEELLARVRDTGAVRPPGSSNTIIQDESQGKAHLPQRYKLQAYGPDGSTIWISGNACLVRKIGNNPPSI